MTLFNQVVVLLVWALVIAWLYFLVRYPSEREKAFLRDARAGVSALCRRFVRAVQYALSTLARRNVRATVRKLHGRMMNDTDPLRPLPELHDIMPLYDNHWPTLVVGTNALTAVYWNFTDEARREQEVLWVGTRYPFRGAVWRLRIVWWRGKPLDDWSVKRWTVDGEPQRTPIPQDWFAEKCFLSNMLCAVKAAKVPSSMLAR